MLCQCRTAFFALAVLLTGGGCRPTVAPEYDGLEAQLLHEAFEAMAERRPQRAERALRRLRDLAPDVPFHRLALERERDRRRLHAFNDALRRADLRALERHLRDDDSAGAYRVSAQVRDTPAALAALREHARHRPYRTVEDAAAALATLRPYQTHLARSATFRQYLEQAERHLAHLRLEERERTVQELVRLLDTAIATTDPRAAHFRDQLRTLAPEHPVVTLAQAADAADWDTLARADPNDPDTAGALEILAYAHDEFIPAPIRTRLDAQWATEAAPHTLCGDLLLVRALVEAGRMADALDRWRRLPASLSLPDSWVERFLGTTLMPPVQYRARCWRTPCPSVIDYLQRLNQLCEQATPLEN